MRRPALLSLALLLPGGGCLPDAHEAAVRVDVSYTFKAGCITVRARDAESLDREDSRSLPVLGREPSTVRMAVFRAEGWSHTLEITTLAHEQTCEGPVVAAAVHTVELRKARVEPLEVTLAAPDGDNDGYIPTAVDGTDCDDTLPNVNPGTAEACDGLDNDCDGPQDEDFPLKGATCTGDCPGGRYVCNASHTDLACDAPARISLFPDTDGDGAGDDLASSSSSVCPDETLPTGTVANRDDCDDLDRHNRRGQAEICDGRDNTCDNTSDEGDVCQGKGWRELNDPALTNNRQWKTVALGTSGFPVWVAGDGGALAVREAAGQAFRSLDGSCGLHNWTVAWVRPTDGVAFLGGASGQLAQHDGTSCSNQKSVPPATYFVSGIIGFPPATVLYVVTTAGRLFTWTPPADPVQQFNLDPESYSSLHALSPTFLLGVGSTEEAPSRPHAASYSGTGTAATRHTLQDTPSPYDGGLRGVWMGSPTFSYAVGDDGLVMRWDGQTTWTRVPPPADGPSVDFTSVVVLDPSSIYTTDTDGLVRRLTHRGWVTPSPHDGPHPLRDIAATSPSNIWAVGDNGRVLHFPE